MNTPVLFLIFNRPRHVNRVFEAIRKVEPEKLFIMADGPRPGVDEDVEKCNQARKVLDNVDWKCEVKTLFFSENKGCGRAVMEGINWFFENVEQGIILEDDCLPEESFFYFCDELLDLYKNEPRVMHINGNNFSISRFSAPDASYHFGSYPQAWGWASWRRAWKSFDFDISNWPDIDKKSLFKKMRWSWYERIIQTRKYDDLHDTRRTDIWDYQWHLTVFLQGGLTIVPKVNLISNIGFGHDATHTKNYRESCTELGTNKIEFPLIHPKRMEADEYVDEVYRRIMIGKPGAVFRMFINRTKNSIRNILLNNN